MLNNKLWMAGFVAGLVAVSGCSQQTEEAADAGQVRKQLNMPVMMLLTLLKLQVKRLKMQL